jgi:hypothetical protein
MNNLAEISKSAPLKCDWRRHVRVVWGDTIVPMESMMMTMTMTMTTPSLKRMEYIMIATTSREIDVLVVPSAYLEYGITY